MEFEYEFVKHAAGVPYKAYFVSIDMRGYHWHADFEIMLILKGSVVIQVNDQSVILKKGDMYITNPFEIHSLKHTDEENIILGLQVDVQALIQVAKDMNHRCFLKQHIQSETELASTLRRVLVALMLEHSQNSITGTMMAMSNLYQLFADMMASIPNHVLSNNQSNQKQQDFDRLKSVITYVNEHYSERILLQDIADLHFISRFHMSHFIKDRLGISFQDFVTQVRLAHAIELIETTSDKIIDIAEQCGFSDIKYLNKRLKQDYQMTSRELRSAQSRRQDMNQNRLDEAHRAFDMEEAFG
jgi:xylan 1,4-beta-xylosidase